MLKLLYVKQLFCIMVTPESFTPPLASSSATPLFLFPEASSIQFYFYFYSSILENQRLPTFTCGTSCLGKAVHSSWPRLANTCPLLGWVLERCGAQKIHVRVHFPGLRAEGDHCGREKGACPPAHVCSSLLQAPFSCPGAGSCLWSSEYHRSKEVLSDLDTPSQVTGAVSCPAFTCVFLWVWMDILVPPLLPAAPAVSLKGARPAQCCKR